MKKRFTFGLLSNILSLALTACGNAAETTSAQEETTNSSIEINISELGGRLKIGNSVFEETLARYGSSFMYFERDEEYGESAQWCVDISFKEGDYNGENISPSISINPIDTEKGSVKELVGEEFEVDDIETCDEREDLFYVYEHEPMCNYHVSVVEVKENIAHVVGSGQLIIDGYADPYTVDRFEFDCWLPIILSASDWDKFEFQTGK